VKEVTCQVPYPWNESSGPWRESAKKQGSSFKVVVMDFGVKYNILRCLVDRACQVQVVPAQTSAQDILSLKPNGVVLSNGPGDPAAVTYAIDTIKRLLEHNEKTNGSLPIFGICLGHQLTGLALGGKTIKLKFGHHGANHPVKDMTTGHVEITTQNHGFAVEATPQNKDIEITHVNLNDGTCEGLRHKRLPVFAVQYHPEASAGPHDSRYLFDRFVEMMERRHASA